MTNANPWPIDFEAKLRGGDDRRIVPDHRLSRRDGRLVWATSVPANGTATLDFASIEVR